MATKAFNSRDIDRLMKWGVGGIVALGIGMGLLVVGSILEVTLVSTFGYLGILAAFALLIITIYPAFK